jgi:hypothetical protein
LKEVIRTADDFETMRQELRRWILPHREHVSILSRVEPALQESI